jgi:hypothetical protein
VSASRHYGVEGAGGNDRAADGVERSVIAFASLQFFSLIYLQKFALFAPAFSLSVPMLIMFVSVGWMVVSGNLVIVTTRLALFLIFFGFCLFSESMNQGSVPSFMQVFLLYACMTVCAHLSPAAYSKILNRFVMLMIVPAVIMIIQYTYQKSTGLSDPINLERLFPKSILMPGFFYNAHYPWNSNFSRPNGFFLLEPSFASAFTACAAILEIAYFRRRWCIVLMVAATVLSMGATGISILVVAAPVMLSRVRVHIAVLIAIVAISALTTAYLMGVPLPLLSRTEELADPNSSGSDRMLRPAMELATSFFDPSFSWIGHGAGSSPLGQVWPLLKILREFGPLAMISFIALYFVGIVKHGNLALTISLSIIYHFTGGYLLSPSMVELLIMFCFLLAPVRELTAADVETTFPRRAPAGVGRGYYRNRSP